MNTQHVLQEAFQHLNGGNLGAAGQLFNNILQQEPHNFSALNGRGFIALQQNLLPQAQADLQASLTFNPKQPFAHKMLGIVLGAMGQFEASMQAFAVALAQDAKDPEVYFNRANFRFQAGQAQEALADLDAAINLRGSYLEARSNRANLLIQQGDFARAEKDLDYLATKATNNPDIWVALGLVCHKLGKHKKSMQCNDRALRLVPNHPDALLNSSSAMHDQGEYPAALEWADKAIAVTPNRAEAYYVKAQALMAMRDTDEGLFELEKAARLGERNPHFHKKLGAIYARRSQYHDAVRALNHASTLDQLDSKTLKLLGDCLSEIGLLEEAISTYQASIEQGDEDGFAHNNLGLVLVSLNRYEEALVYFQQAIRIKPSNAVAISNAAGVLVNLKRVEESIVAYSEARALNQNINWMLGDYLFLMARVCDWSENKVIYTEIVNKLSKDQKTTNPFPLLSSPSSLAIQMKSAIIFASDKYQAKSIDPAIGHRPLTHEKIKIAYISCDFYGHATSFLMAELFELHDRSMFEVIGVCYGQSLKDEMRDRVMEGFDRFLELGQKSDEEIAQKLRELEIDIAIDLKGHTQDSRLGILARRIAPIQIHYLGYPGTLGTKFIDYLVADPTLIPGAHQQFYTEKIVYLPETYQVNDRLRRVANVSDTRSDHGLPEEGFVFCCFNNNWKITPDLFQSWMRILKSIEGSVLWLFEDNEIAARNLKNAATLHGVGNERLVFAKKLPNEMHLARHGHADLFLDTWYYNAHTTASDALWMGLPLITMLGDTYAGRVGASLLRAVDLPALIVETPEAYEALAVELAKHPVQLITLKKKLAANRLSAPLFDTPKFTRNLESAYQKMWARYQAGLAPDHIYV